MYERGRVYLSCHLAGFAHWDGIEAFNELAVGVRLSLRAEPDNPYDPEAVAMYYADRKIGYLPRKHAGRFFQLLYYGHVNLFEAFVNRISPDNYPEGQIGIVVKVRDAR